MRQSAATTSEVSECATHPNAAQAALDRTSESPMPTQIVAALRSAAWPCTAAPARAAQLVSGRSRNAPGHSAIAHAYTRPGDQRRSSHGSATSDTNVPPMPAPASMYPMRAGPNPSPPRATGVNAKRTRRTS